MYQQDYANSGRQPNTLPLDVLVYTATKSTCSFSGAGDSESFISVSSSSYTDLKQKLWDIKEIYNKGFIHETVDKNKQEAILAAYHT